MIVQADAGFIPLADESVDMIFADPPYIQEQIGVYQLVIQEAVRLLKPGKFLALMCGGNQLDRIYQWLYQSGLVYYWHYSMGMVGKRTGTVWKNGNQLVPIATRVKSVLVFSKGDALSRTATVGLYWCGKADKKYHYWGQDVDSHRYFIDCFSYPGDLVLDPVCGGGTTAAACEAIGRRWVVSDLDERALKTTQERLAGPIYSGLPLFGGA